MKHKILLILLIFQAALSFSQFDVNYQNNKMFLQDKTHKNILIPDIPGFQILKGDFHIHTVFSDGEVWPSQRVEAAWREGLDVIAITDHIEYRPHKKHLKADHNSSYELAAKKAKEKNILLIRGAEITKNKVPPGHLNALFLSDVNAIENDDAFLSVEQAVQQGAFILWNHPGWKLQQPDTTMWWDFYSDLQEKNMLHGIEVANSNEWYPVALDWCVEKKLTVFGNSDIHVPINFRYDFSDTYNHRPMTLVFVKERSLSGIRKALFEGNTVAWFGNTLAGKEKLLKALIQESVKLHIPFTQVTKKEKILHYAELRNYSDIHFVLKDKSKKDDEIVLPPQRSIVVFFPKETTQLSYTIINAFYGSQKNIELIFKP